MTGKAGLECSHVTDPGGGSHRRQGPPNTDRTGADMSDATPATPGKPGKSRNAEGA